MSSYWQLKQQQLFMLMFSIPHHLVPVTPASITLLNYRSASFRFSHDVLALWLPTKWPFLSKEAFFSPGFTLSSAWSVAPGTFFFLFPEASLGSFILPY